MIKKNMSNGGLVEQSAHPAQAICRIGLQLGRSRWTLIVGATVIMIAQVIVTLGTVAAAPNNNLIDPQHPLLDAANTLPVVSDVNKSGPENNVLTFLDSDFESAFYDPDGDNLKWIRINSLPANGMLRVNGNPVTAQQEINANLADHMTFSPDAGWSGTTSFSWNGSDNEGYAEDPALVNITIQNAGVPRIALRIEPGSQTVPDGSTAIFAVTITNTGNVELSRLAVDAPQAPACENAFTQLAVNSLVVGQSVDFACSRLFLTAQAPAYHEVVMAVTAVDDQDNPVSAEDDTQVQIVARPVERLLLPVINDGYVAGEPNNHICQAQPLALNLDTFFLPDDPDDWYRFNLTQPGNLTVTLSDFTPVDGQIVLYRGRCAAPMLLKNNGNSETVKVVELGLQPAGYYLIWVITDRNFSNTRPYKLHIQVTDS
jgi:hypothetical protein